MAYDLVIRGSRLVDGSGMPSYRGDVGVKDGRIVAIGRIKSSAAQTIDAGGLFVSPGFIDHHTHMDAQILWDPYATSEPEHGFTSVIMGNCGLTLAPVKSGDEDALVPRHGAMSRGRTTLCLSVLSVFLPGDSVLRH